MMPVLGREKKLGSRDWTGQDTQRRPRPQPGEFPSPLSPAARTPPNTMYSGAARPAGQSTSTRQPHPHPTTRATTQPTPLCLAHPHLFPIFSLSPTCANSSSTSEEVSRECSPVGRKARPGGGEEGSFAADVHASVARLRRSLPARLTNFSSPKPSPPKPGSPRPPNHTPRLPQKIPPHATARLLLV